MPLSHLPQPSKKVSLSIRGARSYSIGTHTLLALWIIATASIWFLSIGYWLAIPAEPKLQRAKAIIVNGGHPTRTLYGVELYRRNLAPKLWHTGYAKGEVWVTALVKWSDPQPLFRYLLLPSTPTIPHEAFHYLSTTSTWSDGTEIAATIRSQKLHRVIIVTDWWHSRRALCSTKQQLQGYAVEIEFAPAPAAIGPDNWWQDAEMRKHVLSEWGKLGYYALRYGMNPWGC